MNTTCKHKFVALAGRVGTQISCLYCCAPPPSVVELLHTIDEQAAEITHLRAQLSEAQSHARCTTVGPCCPLSVVTTP